MTIEILTKEDLKEFKTELLSDIEKLLKSKSGVLQNKEWLKSYEVRKLLGISPGKLQQLRVNGTLEFTQLGGLIFFKHENIIKLMENNKHKNPISNRETYLAKVQSDADLRAKKSKS